MKSSNENPESLWTCERCFGEVREADHPRICPNPDCRAGRGGASSWYRLTR